MFVFVDESGNTGAQLFDEAQPVFTTIALMTRRDFDVVHRDATSELARALDVPQLHAAELGAARIERVARDFLQILQQAGAHFFLSRVEKRYVLAAKMFDLLFDPGENRGAAPHIYMIRPLRLSFALKFATEVPEDLARDFWLAMMEKGPERAKQGMVSFCVRVLDLLPSFKDAGLRERVEQALTWARDNPEAIYFHSDGKVARQGHLPNIVGFGNLLHGVEHYSANRKWPVQQIRHDRQSEFQSALKYWHEVYANASPDKVPLLIGETFKPQRVGGSTLEISSAVDSPGIQAADVILWLFGRLARKKPLGPESSRLMKWVFRRSMQDDFSLESVSARLDAEFGWMLNEDLPPERLEAARDALQAIEEGRATRMSEYASAKAERLKGE